MTTNDTGMQAGQLASVPDRGTIVRGGTRMTEQRIRWFLLVEAIAFAVAALVHSGVLLDGYEDIGARIAESIIALVLLAGLVLSLVRPGSTQDAGIGAQAFALLGTLVGSTLIMVVGPRKALDIVYHGTMIVVLVWGLILAWRAPDTAAGRR